MEGRSDGSQSEPDGGQDEADGEEEKQRQNKVKVQKRHSWVTPYLSVSWTACVGKFQPFSLSNLIHRVY